MRIARVFIAALLACGVAGALAAQIPTRRPAQQGNLAAPRLLVGNPHSFSPEDSAHSVAIGDAMRTRVEKIDNDQFRVLTRDEMNDALKQFGYPSDAILAPLPLRAFAQSLNAKVMIVSTLNHDASGKHQLTARLAGLNDDAGMVVTIPAGTSENHAEIGAKVADGFAPAFKAWSDVRTCVDQSKTAPEKAAAAAKKAIAVVPTHGLANYCLGMLALARGRKADSLEAMRYFQNAVKGDPLSLAAWTQLAAGYEVAGDTAQTIAALRQMLLIAPTNQPLRELAFKKFLAYGHPEAAEQVADDGLKLDPSNTDLFELRANARAFRENYSGALDDLEQIVALDSTKADSSFYIKFLVFASQKPDSARLVQWSSAALRRFPDNQTLLKQVAAAYAQVGQADSLVPVLKKLVAVDSVSAVGLALQEAKALQDEKNYPGSDPYVAFAAKYGDAQARDGAAAFMLQGVTPMLQPPQNWQALADSTKAILALANPTGKVAPIAEHFRGLALVNLVAMADKQAEAQKSCEIARSIETMTSDALAAFSAASAYASQQQARDQMAGYLNGLKPRTASMIRVYCK
jgi:tetratricopeptide (TPR) repeat protein